jgi:Rab GDP dissociation inhibitor
MQLYSESLGKYGNSPFLYPVYGLGGLPESFSRLCAIHGGTYMLNTNVDKVLFNEDGKVCGIQSGENKAMAPLVICDPSYIKDMGKTKTVGRVIRAICILDHPIPNTDNATSIQIILPQKQLKRKSGKYLSLRFFNKLQVSNLKPFCKILIYRCLHHDGVPRSCRLR